MKIKLLLLTFLLYLTGCAIRPNADDWIEKTINTKYLSFQVWEKDIKKGEPLRIYIEGEGQPTPKKPIGFELAKNDTHQNVIYLSRPCQYVDCAECKNPALWQEERFHEEIINEIKSLVVYLSHKYETPKLDLIGFEGGGSIAMLLATKIPVYQVITVAGILDTQSYAQQQNIKINGLNPFDFKEKLSQITQTHYVGEKDNIIDRSHIQRFVDGLRNPKSIQIKVVSDATHTDWQGLEIE